MAFWANLIGYQATWLAVVCSAGRGMPWIGMLACVVFIALQWSASRTRAGDGWVLVAALACGIVVDGVAAATGLLAYAAPMPALPDVPTVLLTSVQARAGSDLFQETPAIVKIKRERHAAFLGQFSSGAHVFTPNSGHGIQMQEPELVIAAIGQVMTLATQGAARVAKAQARQTLMHELEQCAALLDKQQHDAAAARVDAALWESALSEAEINTLGFDLLTKAKQTALATLVLAYNSQAHAQSDNAADSYGEALLAGARPAEAQRQFARAVALGQANGAREQAMAGYRQHLSQAEQALKQP